MAIPLWGTWPVLATQVAGTPPLEFSALSFMAASAILWPLERKPTVDQVRAWLISVAFGLAEVGSATFFLLSLRSIAPAEANMVVYMWPAMVTILAILLKLHLPRWGPISGITLGIISIVILFGGQAKFVLDPRGIGAALAAGLSWALYVVLRLKWREDVGPFLARGALVAAIVCVLLHLMLENTTRPSSQVMLAAVGVGALPTAIANIWWDCGMRRGDSQLLTVLAYATPLTGALLLALFGQEALTWRLAIAGGLIGFAGLVSRESARTGDQTPTRK